MARTKGNSQGLRGPKSGMFWNMISVIQWIQKYNEKYKTQLHIVLENNASMTNTNKELITTQIQKYFKIPISITVLNGSNFGVQTRRRVYWTTFEVSTSGIECCQTWSDVLQPLEKCTNKLITNTMNKPFLTGEVRCHAKGVVMEYYLY
jgi:site-specific DNA-cytosine methylase